LLLGISDFIAIEYKVAFTNSIIMGIC